MRTFGGEDPFSLDEQLNGDERLVRDSARTYARKTLTRIRDANRDEFFHREIMNEMGELVWWAPLCPRSMVAQALTMSAMALPLERSSASIPDIVQR